MNKDLLLKTFLNTTGAAIYVFLVSQIMQHGNQWFGKEDNIITPVVFLLLFSLSAAIMASAIFGQSFFLFFENKKKESILAAIYSIGWIGFYTLLGILALALLNLR